MSKRMSLQEYQEVISEGDIIRTNGDNDRASATKIIEGRVSNLSSRGFELLGHFWTETQEHSKRSCQDWQIYLPCEDSDIWVELIQSFAKRKKVTHVVKDKSIVKKPKKATLFIKIERLKGEIKIHLTIPQEVEEHYKDLAKDIQEQSQSWLDDKNVGLVYYKFDTSLQDRERNYIDYETYNNFGRGLIDGNRINTALLRVKGASNGIVITSKNFCSISKVEMKNYAERLGKFVKILWENTISEQTIEVNHEYEF